MSVFLTGGTGFLGSQLLLAMLKSGESVVAHARADSPARARQRLLEALEQAGGAGGSDHSGGSLSVVLGDLSRTNLGMSERDRERIRQECDEFLHCGATVRFNGSLENAERVNVAATRSVLELASGCPRGARRVDYISTAFVAGNRRDVVLEDELDGGAGHKNHYERTKFEAEGIVRAAASELPVAIHRPSIVVGESKGGVTTAFRTIYGPLKIYARGLWRTCPADPGQRVDLVPVDFVRDVVMAARRSSETLGKCLHIAAGPDGSMSLGELASEIHRVFPARRPVRFVNPDLWARFAHPVLRCVRFGNLASVISEGRHYLPYLARMPEFDISNTKRVAKDAGLHVPDVREFIHRTLGFCVKTDFGRRVTCGERESVPAPIAGGEDDWGQRAL